MNFLHHKSKELATKYDAVIIEDLDMKGMSQGLHFGKSVHDNGWGMFTQFLRYKLKQQGKQLVKIDKWFPSTKDVLAVVPKRKCIYQNVSINIPVALY